MPVSSGSQLRTPSSSRRIQLTLAELLVLLPAVPAACFVVTAYVIEALGGPIHPWLIAAMLIVELLMLGLWLWRRSWHIAGELDGGGLRLSCPFRLIIQSASTSTAPLVTCVSGVFRLEK
jgi:hypothetical protein